MNIIFIYSFNTFGTNQPKYKVFLTKDDEFNYEEALQQIKSDSKKNQKLNQPEKRKASNDKEYETFWKKRNMNSNMRQMSESENDLLLKTYYFFIFYILYLYLFFL